MDRLNTKQNGFCECGCGGKTKIATRSDAVWGKIKGKPLRYIQWHHRKGKGKDPLTLVEKCNKSGCWNWKAFKDKNGYGRFASRSNPSAHRYFFERFKGPIPKGLQIDHLCRNRSCVNPEHLEAVTHTENCRRGARTKLTIDDVSEIKYLRKVGLSTIYLGREYGVHQSTISDICRGKSWAQIV